MRVFCILFFVLILSACSKFGSPQKKAAIVTAPDPAPSIVEPPAVEAEQIPDPIGISDVSFVDSKLKISGTNLDSAISVTLRQGTGPLISLQIEQKSASEIILRGVGQVINLSLDVVSSLFISNAYGQTTTTQISFNVKDGSLSLLKLSVAGAQSGDTIKFDGSKWVVSKPSSNLKCAAGKFVSGLEVDGSVICAELPSPPTITPPPPLGTLAKSTEADVVVCGLDNEGRQRYNSATKLVEFCNGSSWITGESGYGGQFKWDPWSNCVDPNPRTGGCSCPAGYNANYIYAWTTGWSSNQIICLK